MIQGVICTEEIAKASNNVLGEFCNFNQVFTWNKPSGGANASILNDTSGRQSYLGIGAVAINFTGNGEVAFNSGDSSMERVIQRTGSYILSYGFAKSDPGSTIVFTVELYVNGVLQPNNTITQDLDDSSGFVNDKYNCYFQNVDLEYGDLIDFSFRAQSDTTACYLYFDRLKLEIDDKGNSTPTIYTEAPLEEFQEENTLTLGAIPAGGSIEVTAALTGANTTDKRYVLGTYPSELNTLGLIVSQPIVTATNVVKFRVYNPTGGIITPTADGIYNFKIIR